MHPSLAEKAGHRSDTSAVQPYSHKHNPLGSTNATQRVKPNHTMPMECVSPHGQRLHLLCSQRLCHFVCISMCAPGILRIPPPSSDLSRPLLPASLDSFLLSGLPIPNFLQQLEGVR